MSSIVTQQLQPTVPAPVSPQLFTTSFRTEILNSAFTVPSAPANTKEVVIFNDTSSVLTFSTNYGQQTILQGGTIEFSVNDYETGITFGSVTLVSGTFNVGERVVLNYKTSV